MNSRTFSDIFAKAKPIVIGMVHVRALPGSPKHQLSMNEIRDIAVRETEIYMKHKLDGVIIENMNDLPYLCGKQIGPEIVASMATVAMTIKKNFPELPIGIQVLKAGNEQSLAVAKSVGCAFIRAECFVFSHISDAGFLNSSAAQLLRYRKKIESEDILIFTDVKKKHSSHAITSDLSLIETANAAEFFLSDGLIVTGSATGQPANHHDAKELKENTKLPVLIGSGVTQTNVEKFMNVDGLIIGSHFKKDGLWNNEVDELRIMNFMNKINQLKN